MPNSSLPYQSYMDGLVVVAWPSPAGPAPKGIVVALHGCAHAALSFVTFPEHRSVVRKLVTSGLVVVAVSSTEADQFGGGCWDGLPFADGNEDIPHVVGLLTDFFKLNKDSRLEALPMYILGASSGGTFATLLASHLPSSVLTKTVAGVAVYISPGNREVLKALTMPVVFVHMQKDSWASADAVARASKLVGGPVKSFMVKPKPVTKAELSLKLELADDAAATTIYNSLVKDKVIGDKTGDLLLNPRSVDAGTIAAIAATTPFLGQDRSLLEYLNACYAQHEMTDAFIDDVIAFLLR